MPDWELRSRRRRIDSADDHGAATAAAMGKPDAYAAGGKGVDAASSSRLPLDGGRRVLGCEHYRRACQTICKECNAFWPCHVCHDETITSHTLDRCGPSRSRRPSEEVAHRPELGRCYGGMQVCGD